MASTKSTLHRAFGIDVAAHGDSTGTTLDANSNLEVISLGLSRTGTTSLQLALGKLGFALCHGGVDLFRSPTRTDIFIDLLGKVVSGVWVAGDPELSTRLRELMRGYRSVTDVPNCYLTPETYAAYPEARYILTIRPGGKHDWFKSLLNATGWHFRRDWGRYVFRSLIWPVRFLRRNDDMVQLLHALWVKKYGALDAEMYDKHNQEVKQTVPAAQLLVFDVREGWEPLCNFLKVPVPDEPVPKLNDAEAMKAIYFGMMAYGAFFWMVYGCAAAAAGYIAYEPEVGRTLLVRAVNVVQHLSLRLKDIMGS